jgi:hypothetical protein
VLLALAATAQAPSPPVDPRRIHLGSSSEYGEPVFAELTSIAFGPEVHQRQHVRTRGRLEPLDEHRYYLLTDGTARVLVLFVDAAASDADKFVGHDLDVNGVVRMIRPKEYIAGVDRDLVEDPTLPVLPAPRSDRPKVSLTVLGMSAREGASGRARGAGRSGAAELLANPPAAGQKAPPVVILGLFRGRNLFGELPESSRRKPSDWVLKDGATAFWVTGKEPKGQGWSLDPGYRGDTARWLEVEGRPEVAGGILYLQATKLRLVKPPPVDTGDEPPPESQAGSLGGRR